MDSIVALLRLAYAGGALTLVQTQRLYRFLVWALAGVILIVLVGWLCNLAGWRGVSIILSLALTALTIIVWFEPKHVAAVAGAGAAVGAVPGVPGTVVSATATLLQFYIDLLGKLLLWGSVLLFTLGTTPFGENPFVIFSITAGLLLLVFIQWQWKIGTDKGKRLFHGYVCVMLVLFVATLIPGAVWVKYTGWDPKTELGTSSTEDLRYEIQRARMGKQEELEGEALKLIRKRVQRGEMLYPSEESLLHPKESKAPAAKIGRLLATATAPECTEARPCSVPGGKTLCFESGIDLETVGFRSRLRGGPVKGAGGFGDTFWFDGSSTPRHWLVSQGSSC